MGPNRIAMIIRHFVAVLSAIYVASNLAGCSDPTKPKEVRYNLYVGAANVYTSADSAVNRIYFYDADSLTVRDSLSQLHFAEQLDVSPDGRWLYVTGFTSDLTPRMVWKIDTRTKQAAWSRSDLWGVRCLGNGALLLAGRDVLRTEDGSLVRHLSDTLYPGWGPARGTSVAAIVPSSLIHPGNDSIVTLLDVATGQTSGRYVAHLSSGMVLEEICTVRLHPDGRRILAIGDYASNSNAWFVVGDIVTGRTLFEYRINHSGGEIAISGDGSLAALTDPGVIVFGEVGMPYVVDLQTYNVRTSNPQVTLTGGQVRFLPDDHHILVAPTSSLWDGGPLQVLDATTMDVEKTIWPRGHEPQNWPPIGGLTIGPRP